MKVIQVTDNRTVNEFHLLPEKIYKNDKNWVPSLRVFIENTFHPEKNAKFKIGNARRWIVIKDGVCVGRIAAFYDNDYSEGYEQPTGGCGFFESVNDKEVAFLLFDTAKNWLQENGMEAMDGPINFGENFFYWGLLVQGFQQQTFGMQYNPGYYRELFEAYGFKTFYEQYSYSLDITYPDLPDRFWKIAEWVAKQPGYSYDTFKFRYQDKYIDDFINIHQQAWGNHGNYKPIRSEEMKDVNCEARIFMDDDFIVFVYHYGQPIAFLIMIPDLNQIIKQLNTSKLNFLKLLKILYLKRKKVITRCRVVALGVISKYQNKGIESALFYYLKQILLGKRWYKEMEMSWVGDFNPKMISLSDSFGATRTMTHLTLRYLFDENKPFVRAPIIG